MNVKQFSILLADDDKDDRFFFSMALEALTEPIQLEIVMDGEKLMAYLDENSHQLPDVLFLDLNMPRKNGFECLSEIKLNKKLNLLPVIIYSTSFEQDVVNQLYKNGAQYYIRKPAEFSQLKKLIQQTVTLLMRDRSALKNPSETGKTVNILQPTRENFELTLQNSLII